MANPLLPLVTSLPPAAILTLVLPYLGSFLANVLKQRHWRSGIKDGIAWGALVIAALVDGIVTGQISINLDVVLPHLSVYFGVLVSIVALIASGPLTQLSPWLVGMVWVEHHLFNVVPTPKATPVPTPTPQGTGPGATPPLLSGAPFWSKPQVGSASNPVPQQPFPAIPPTDIKKPRPVSENNPKNAG